MKRKPAKSEPDALAALKRASLAAIELAKQTKTPAWIMIGNKLVDATKLPQNRKKTTK